MHSIGSYTILKIRLIYSDIDVFRGTKANQSKSQMFLKLL